MLTELLNVLRENFPSTHNGEEDSEWSFDAHAAIWWYAHDYYDGQADPLYRVLCSSPFRPSCLHTSIENEESDIACDMYDFLASRQR